MAAIKGDQTKPLATNPRPPPATKPSTKTATAAPAEIQRAVDKPSRSPRVDRRAKRTGLGPSRVTVADDMSYSHLDRHDRLTTAPWAAKKAALAVVVNRHHQS